VILISVIVWLLVVLAMTAWVGLRGWQLYRRVRSIQKLVEQHVPRARIEEIRLKAARLQERQAVLQGAVAEMQESLSKLSFVTTTGKTLVAPLMVLRFAVRRK
jgi:hypothetical protein